METIPYDKRTGKIWFNGNIVDWQSANIHILNHGLHYASCVFEGERVYDGEIFKLAEHTKRLFYSAKRMGIKVPYSENELNEACKKIINVQKVNKVILHNHKKKDSRIQMLKQNNIKFVTWGRVQDLKNYSWVDLDNEASVNLIVDYLVSKNHKNIACINIIENYNFAYLRKMGYLNSLKKHKIEYNKNFYITVKTEEPDQNAILIKEMLIQNPEITSLICSTEYSGVGAIKACQELNIEIGKDISIVTFDGPVIESLSNPPLTAITHPRKELGLKAIEILLSMDNKSFSHQSYLAKP